LIDPPWYVASLNKLIDQPALLSEDAYFSMAGLKKDNIVEKINKGLRKKFKNLKEDELITVIGNLWHPNDIMAFAYLYKNLEFETPFYKTNPMELEKKNEENVIIKTFGIDKFDLSIPEHQKLFKQIKLLYCNAGEKKTADKPEGYIIAFITKYATDELIISNLKVEETLEKTYNIINECIESKTNANTEELVDGLIIPTINFDIVHSFNELSRSKFSAPKVSDENVRFSNVIQKIKFILNDRGTKLISYNIITSLCRPRKYRFDFQPPFLVLLRSKGCSAPYFIAYIDNEELLETIKPELIPIYTKGGVLDYTSEVNISISQAILNGASRAAIQKMIKSGANINAIDKYGECAIRYAFDRNNYEIIKLLLENNADVSTTGCELLYKNISKTVEYLIVVTLQKYDEEYRKNKAINIAIEDFSIQHDILNIPEIKQRIDKTHKVIQLLLKSKIDNFDLTDVMSLLLSTSIYFTAEPFEKIVAELVNAGADIKQSNSRGETILIIATKKKMSIEFIKKLIEKGADIKAIDKKGHDALYYAKENKMDAVVKLLDVK